MRLLVFLFFILAFNPAFAGPLSSSLEASSSVVSILNFDKDAFTDKSKKRKTYFGSSIKYIVDYDPSDKQHNSVTNFFVHDDSGQFYTLEQNTIIKASKQKTVLINSTTDQATGNQRVLVIPVGDLTVSSQSFIFNPDVLRAAFFSITENSLNTYYKEVSSSKVSFSGDFTNLFLVDRLCEGGDIFKNGGVDFLIEQVDSQIDLSVYDRVSFVFPDDSFCLGGALGVGTFGKISYINPFGKQTSISINWNRSAGAEIGNTTYFLKVITHEFGHNFGLQHDNANACGEEIFNSECSSLEYGGVHSIMGFSPNLAHVNAIHQHDLKWLTDNQVVILDEPSVNSEFKLVPLAKDDNVNLKAIKVKRNDGSYYAIEYREPFRMETAQYSTRNLSYGGIQIYLNNDNHQRDSVLIRKDFKVFNSKDSSEAFKIFDLASFTPGEVFYDSVSDIRITPTALDSEGISVLIEKGLEDGGGTSSEDSYFHDNNGAYRLNAKGITSTKLSITFNGDFLANAKIKIIIPSQYKKLLKLKKTSLNLSSNLIKIPSKIAPRIKFEELLQVNEQGLFEINVQMQLIDKASNRILVDSIVPLLFDPQS